VFRFGGFLMVFIAFYIKMPIYLMHVWLPKAHVEAPVYGSIILAGILLKIGRYGLIRFLEIFVKIRIKYNFVVVRVGIVGRVLIRLRCLVQIDMKRLVAYSSVVHINIMLCRMITLFKLGFIRGYIIIISHGLCSSGLFYIVNLYYERTFRRLLIINKGIIIRMPRIRLLWFLLCVINFSFPLSLGFFREIFTLRVILSWDLIIIFFLILVCFFRRAYSLYLFSYVQHGNKRCLEIRFNLGILKEYLVVILHILPLILILINLLIFMYLSSLRKNINLWN
jgi:NADH-ubiquinone oxidoreductase chain 4